MKTYIYRLTDNIVGEPLYIGLTQSPSRRWYGHTTDSRFRKEDYLNLEYPITSNKGNWLKWVYLLGGRWSMGVIGEVDGHRIHAHRLEQFHIDRFRRKGKKLTNREHYGLDLECPFGNMFDDIWDGYKDILLGDCSWLDARDYFYEWRYSNYKLHRHEYLHENKKYGSFVVKKGYEAYFDHLDDMQQSA